MRLQTSLMPASYLFFELPGLRCWLLSLSLRCLHFAKPKGNIVAFNNLAACKHYCCGCTANPPDGLRDLNPDQSYKPNCGPYGDPKFNSPFSIFDVFTEVSGVSAAVYIDNTVPAQQPCYGPLRA